MNAQSFVFILNECLTCCMLQPWIRSYFASKRNLLDKQPARWVARRCRHHHRRHHLHVIKFKFKFNWYIFFVRQIILILCSTKTRIIILFLSYLKCCTRIIWKSPSSSLSLSSSSISLSVSLTYFNFVSVVLLTFGSTVTTGVGLVEVLTAILNLGAAQRKKQSIIYGLDVKQTKKHPTEFTIDTFFIDFAFLFCLNARMYIPLVVGTGFGVIETTSSLSLSPSSSIS